MKFSLFPSSGLLMCEEKPHLITDFVLSLQREAEELTDGFSVQHKGGEYDFLPTYRDRSQSQSRILTTANCKS